VKWITLLIHIQLPERDSVQPWVNHVQYHVIKLDVFLCQFSLRVYVNLSRKFRFS
jgi:hypothetical protein